MLKVYCAAAGESDGEPLAKKQRLQVEVSMAGSVDDPSSSIDEGEGTLVINTRDAQQVIRERFLSLCLHVADIRTLRKQC
jgi:hypothetical protein